MGILVGYLIRIITFPGLILDAVVNKYLVEYSNLQIESVDYFAIQGNVPVIHELPKEYNKIFSIAILPFLIMTAITILLFSIGIFALPIAEPFFAWLGISIAAHSFPSTEIGQILWSRSIEEIKTNKNYLAIIGFPIVIVIFIARILHFFWLDVIYGVVLFSLMSGELNL